VLPKIAEVRRRIERTGRDIWLEVDGGVKVENIAEIAAAGADTFVAGSAIFGSKDYAATVREMRARLAAARPAAGGYSPAVVIPAPAHRVFLRWQSWRPWRR